LTVLEAAGLLLDEDEGLLVEEGDELPHAASPMQAMDSSAVNPAPLLLVMATMART
jgi:hypothetical protein